MQIALKDSYILIRGVDPTQYPVIKSWGLMTWDRRTQLLTGRASLELLDKLAGIAKLPDNIEAERQRLRRLAEAVDAERVKEEPVPLYKYPVKQDLFKHQIRGCNMALLIFGAVQP